MCNYQVLCQYSTQSDKSRDYWRMVNSRRKRDLNNPHYLVEKFLIDNPSDRIVDVPLLKSILGISITDYKLTEEDFSLLKNIKPKEIDFPFEEHIKTVTGKPLRGGRGSAGVYVFTNKFSQEKYVGSSINLSLRLRDGYFKMYKTTRKIEESLQEYGPENFTLEVYIIPSFVTKAVNLNNKILYISILKNLTITLEQILILELNPELNDIMVAGSSPGALFNKNSKKTYLYDEIKKELIYISESRKEMAEVLGYNVDSLKRYFKVTKLLYLKRFMLTEYIEEGNTYTINLMKQKDLEKFISKVKLERQAYIKEYGATRDEINVRRSKRVELTNIISGKVMNFNTLKDMVKYIQDYDIKFSNVKSSTLSQNVRSGRPYKHTFTARYLD